MQQPNWFDNKYDVTMQKASAEECLAMIGKEPRLVDELKKALATHDVDSKKPGWAGPSRSQVVRKTVAGVLQAMS